jgi:hypothetical protein
MRLTVVVSSRTRMPPIGPHTATHHIRNNRLPLSQPLLDKKSHNRNNATMGDRFRIFPGCSIRISRQRKSEHLRRDLDAEVSYRIEYREKGTI